MENQKLTIERFEKALFYVDKVLPLLPEFATFNLSTAIIDSNWSEEEKDEAYNLEGYMQTLLIDRLKYVNGNIGAFDIELNDIGRQVKKAGGHFAYLKKLANKEAEDRERQKLNDEKLKYDVKNGKRIFKTYWWTFGFALVSFIYVFIQIILKIVEATGTHNHR